MFYFISPNNCVSTSAVLIERKIFDQNMHQCIPPSLPGVLGTVFFKTRKFPTGLKPGRTIFLDFDLSCQPSENL